jgi:hypothetical protein
MTYLKKRKLRVLNGKSRKIRRNDEKEVRKMGLEDLRNKFRMRGYYGDLRTVKLFKKKIQEAAGLTVETGTNTPQGGDAGHGGITVFRLEQDGADWALQLIDQSGKPREWDRMKEITLVLCGDAEASIFVKALSFATRALRKQRRKTESEIIMNQKLASDLQDSTKTEQKNEE